MTKIRLIALFCFLAPFLYALHAEAIQMTATWSLPTDPNRKNIRVERQDGGTGAFVNQTPTPLAGTATTFNQAGLLLGTQYCYRFVPTGDLGDAPTPQTICGTPGLPLNLSGITIIFAP